jgi:hypothetical protein
MITHNELTMEDYRKATSASRLSPVQLKMVEILSDGKLHEPNELHKCLRDEMGELSNISPHLGAIRKILRGLGEDVATVRLGGKTYYQKRSLQPD